MSSNVQLREMSDEEFAVWAPRSRSGFADSNVQSNGFTREEADKIADDAFNRILPDGLHSKNNFLFHLISGDQTKLGMIWYNIRGNVGNQRAFICDVMIEPEFRGRGYGRKIMELVELHAKERGLQKLELHVFGHNSTAIGLYQSLGYQTTDLTMAKKI